MNETLDIANHIVNTSYESLRPEVAEITKTSLIDSIGVTLATSSLGDEAKPFVEQAKLWGAGPCSVIGFPFKTSAPMAAFANGAMAHVLDFEDTHDFSLVHPNASTIPAALATAEAIGNVSGKELITAIALGCDLASRLGMGFNDSPQNRGWYLMPVMGAYGATAAAGKLLGLTADQLVQAFSLALCQATISGELKHSPDSKLRAIRDAFTAKAGVVAAYLAKSDVTGFDHAFEGKAGLYGLYGNSDWSPERLMKDLGKFYEGENISFKPWPSCRGAHPFIEAALILQKKHNIQNDRIEAIDATVSRIFVGLCEPIEQKRAPKLSTDAKFSIPFNVAVALCYGKVGLGHFTEQGMADPRTLAIAAKVSCRIDDSLGFREATTGVLDIKLKSGEMYSARVEFPLGHPNNPMQPEALREKFLDCVSYAKSPLSTQQAGALLDRLLHLEGVKDVRELGLNAA